MDAYYVAEKSDLPAIARDGIVFRIHEELGGHTLLVHQEVESAISKYDPKTHEILKVKIPSLSFYRDEYIVLDVPRKLDPSKISRWSDVESNWINMPEVGATPIGRPERTDISDRTMVLHEDMQQQIDYMQRQIDKWNAKEPENRDLDQVASEGKRLTQKERLDDTEKRFNERKGRWESGAPQRAHMRELSEEASRNDGDDIGRVQFRDDRSGGRVQFRPNPIS